MQIDKLDDFKLLAYGILITVVYIIANVLFSFDRLLREYYLLDTKTVEKVFWILLIVLIAIDKFQDWQIANKKKK